MTTRLDGQVALVTGAGNGLGREYALLLAQLGAAVVVNDLGAALDGTAGSDAPAEAVCHEIRAAGGQAVANRDSVTDAEGTRRMVAQAVETFGRLDILVCNAGILRDRSFLKMTEADFRDVMEVHVMGAFHGLRAAAEVMATQGYGRIVLTTSPSGLFGNFGQTNYAAAKMALVGMANTLKLELGRKGIAINCLSPSATTRMTQSLLAPKVARALDPAAVAPMLAWLCSPACTCNGEILVAGGGHYALARLYQGPGITLAKPDIDDIAAAMPRIMEDRGMLAFPSGIEQTARLLGAAQEETTDV